MLTRVGAPHNSARPNRSCIFHESEPALNVRQLDTVNLLTLQA